MNAIHQLVAGFSLGDSISNEATTLRDLFRSWGHDSDIFCDHDSVHPELQSRVRSLDDARSAVQPADVALLHFSIGSPVNDVFRQLNAKKILRYHNITPAEYIEPVNPRTAQRLREGREALARLAGVAHLNLAVSRFNAAELAAAGYEHVDVVPILQTFDPGAMAADPGIVHQFDDDLFNVLYVGRAAPNKALDDLVRLFAAFQRHVEPRSRLIHVGSQTGMEIYAGTVIHLARRLGLPHVHFAGSVSESELAAYYTVANLFLCASEHEGFGIPLLEAMAYDVPVMAYAAGAVPETLDGAGVLFHRKDPAMVAEIMGEIAHNHSLREQILQGQRKRLAAYRALDVEGMMRQHVDRLL